MKNIIIVLFLFILNSSWAQLSSSQRWEKAHYEVNINGEKAYMTSFIIQEDVSVSTIAELTAKILEKDGVIELLKKEGNVFEIFHLGFVELQSFKDILHPFSEEIDFFERVKIKL